MRSGAGGLRFKSWAGQIGNRVADGSHCCYISLKEAVLPGRNDVEMGPANSLQASAYTASIIIDLIDLVYAYEKKYNEKQTQS